MKKRYYDYETLCEGMRDVVLENGALHRCIDNGVILGLPLADVVERKKGKWIKRGPSLYTCSECARFSPTKENFCPTCGADMREEKTDD